MTTVTKSDILSALRTLGLSEGDIALFHSSLKSMGYVEGGADAVIDAFLEAVGPSGTVVAPTLSQKNFEHAYEEWSMDRPSDVGFITETFRLRKEAVRSDQATHSVAAIGPKAVWLTCEHTSGKERFGIFGSTPFSHLSPWQKLRDKNAWLVFVGVTMRKCTMKHLIEYGIVEEKLEAIKRDVSREALKAEVWEHAHFGTPGIWPFYDAEKMQETADKAGLVSHARCGDAEFVAVRAGDYCDFAEDILKKERYTRFAANAADWLDRCERAATYPAED